MTEKKGKKKSLWWSSFSTYQGCPQQFLWKYGHPEHDLGDGLGNPKPKPDKRSEHHLVMGNVIQYAIERMYNDLLWVRLQEGPPEESKQRSLEFIRELKEIIQLKLQSELERKYIKWSEYGCPTEADMLEVCTNGVMGYLSTMKAHKLIGEYARAEKLLLGYVGEVGIGSRIDMIIRRDPQEGVEDPTVGVTLLDGKNTKHKDKYPPDPDQLRWYALTFYLTYNRLPDRMGFVYYRFPYGTPIEGSDEVEQGIEWVPVEREDIRGLASRILAVRENIESQKFEANPVPKNCKFCDWEEICPERQEQKAENRKKYRKRRKEVSDEELGFPEFVPGEDGIQEL